jgi:hypothetical protein
VTLPLRSAQIGGDTPAEVCTDQTCGKCSPGVSDTLGEQVECPVGVYERGVLQWELCKGVVAEYSISINSVALRSATCSCCE